MYIASKDQLYFKIHSFFITKNCNR